MTPAARTQAVIEVLESLSSHPADHALKRYLSTRRYIGAKDRRVITAHYYTILRHRAALAWWAQRDAPRLLVLASFAFRLAEGDAEALFNGAAHAPSPLTAPEKTLLQHWHGHALHPDNQPVHIRYNLPPWLFDALCTDYPKDWPALLAALAEEAPTDIRVNALRATRAQVQQALISAGITAQPIEGLPYGLRLHTRSHLSVLPMFQKGGFEVQDAGSQWVALATEVQPGETVLDFCAGAGGKTLAFASMMANHGKIIASDISQARLEECQRRCERAGVTIAEQRHINDLAAYEQRCNHVVVDAPCSGTGTLRRNPDARFRYQPQHIEDFVHTQREVLRQAARYVAPGGVLTYITCSLLHAENQHQAAWFLAQDSRFMSKKTTLKNSGNLISSSPEGHLGLQLLPSSHKTDGLYVVQFIRQTVAS